MMIDLNGFEKLNALLCQYSIGAILRQCSQMAFSFKIWCHVGIIGCSIPIDSYLVSTPLAIAYHIEY